MEDFTKKVRKFKVGDEVYSPHFGKGIVTGIDTNKLFMYPIHVDWTDKKQSEFHHSDIFTPEGFYTVGVQNSEMNIVPAEEADAKGFKLMDRVFYPYYGRGTVVADYRSNVLYPIKVKWDKSPIKDKPYSNFTRDGWVSVPIMEDEENLRLMLLEDIPKEETGGSEMGQIAGVINHNIAKKMKEDNAKMGAEGEKFKVGDHVWSFHFGIGTVTAVNDATNDPYPISVKWTDNSRVPNTYGAFTKDGKFDSSGEGDPDKDITPFEVIDWSKKEDTGVVDRIEEALSKKTDDAINPSHYKVKGLPEAHEIINHLMHREQYEGFLWGNILKYAYRFGRKGDKAETAGKIAWYATQLKELEEEKNK